MKKSTHARSTSRNDPGSLTSRAAPLVVLNVSLYLLFVGWIMFMGVLLWVKVFFVVSLAPVRVSVAESSFV